MGIAGKVAVVTGVTSGAGRGIALEFAHQGARVVGTGRRRELGEEVERAARAEGGDLTFVQGDVSVVADCDRMIEAAAEAYGRIDILVNNAGTVGTPAIVSSHEATEEWWDQNLDTNLKGAFFCSCAAVRHMRQQRSGVILNISSINGVARGPARMAAYTAAKAGLIALTQTMAVEYLPDRIRINAIALGAIDGDTGSAVSDGMARFVLGPDAELPPGPAGRSFNGEKLGRTLALLCDDDARMTGAVIAIDAGVSAGSMDSDMWYRLASGRL